MYFLLIDDESSDDDDDDDGTSLMIASMENDWRLPVARRCVDVSSGVAWLLPLRINEA